MLRQLPSQLISFFCLINIVFTLAAPAKGQSVRIGAIFALSGIAAQSNKQAVLGTKLAVEEINQQGGLLGQTLDLVLFDNHSTPIGSHLAAEKAIAAGVTAIIGSVWSSHSLAIAKVAEKNGIPMISTNSTIPSLTSIGNHIFRICYDDNFQGTLLAEFAYKDLQARTALIFVDLASDFSLNLSEIFSQTFQTLGGTIKREIEYKAGHTDYSSQVQEALANDADIVLLSGHDESGILAKKLQQAGLRAIPLGSDGWDNEFFFSSGGNTITKGYFASHWLPTSGDSRSKAFLERYGNIGEIQSATALAYDAVNILAAAITMAGSTDKEMILDSLRRIDRFEGVTGDISFDDQGNAEKKGFIVEIREGVPNYLKSYAHE